MVYFSGLSSGLVLKILDRDTCRAKSSQPSNNIGFSTTFPWTSYSSRRVAVELYLSAPLKDISSLSPLFVAANYAVRSKAGTCGYMKPRRCGVLYLPKTLLDL